MNIDSTAKLSDKAVIVEFKWTIAKKWGQSFKHNRQKDWKRVGSRQQEGNKQKI